MPDDLNDRIEKQSADSDRRLVVLTEEVAGDYRRVLSRYTALYQRAIANADFSEDTARRLAVARNISNELDVFLEQAGAPEFYQVFGAQHGQIASLSREYFSVFRDDFNLDPVVKLSGTSQRILRELTVFNVEQIGVRVEQSLVTPLRQQLISGVLSDQNSSEMRQALIDNAEEIRPDQVEALIDDIYGQFNRTVHEKQAEDLGLDVIFYNGPLDNRRSAQCRYMTDYTGNAAPGIWTKKEFTQRRINTLLAQNNIRNGGKSSKIAQLTGDPKIQGGHFQCRHGVNYVSRKVAVERMGAVFNGQ